MSHLHFKPKTVRFKLQFRGIENSHSFEVLEQGPMFHRERATDAHKATGYVSPGYQG